MAEETNKAAAAPPPAPAANGWDGKLPLRQEIPSGNGTDMVKEIVFREPTAGDIERIGNPVLIELYEQKPKMHFDTRAMTMMLAHLANVPPPVIRAMHPKDWNNAAWLIANFFVPDL
jgi:Phage tail assembly chaperone proteins, E, or 41 or 14